MTPRPVMTSMPKTEPQKKSMTPLPMMVNQQKGAQSSNQQNSDEGWINIPAETPRAGDGRVAKRNLGYVEKQPMEVPQNVEKVSQLRAQIAILQRELDKETQGHPANSQ